MEVRPAMAKQAAEPVSKDSSRYRRVASSVSWQRWIEKIPDDSFRYSNDIIRALKMVSLKHSSLQRSSIRFFDLRRLGHGTSEQPRVLLSTALAHSVHV